MGKSTYRKLKDVWQILPVAWNDRIRQLPIIGKAIRWIADLTAKGARHQELYDSRYYDYVDRTASASAQVMATSLIAKFALKTVIDIGCGTGALLATFRGRGIFAFGLEYSDAGLEICKARGLTVSKFDLEHPETRGMPLRATDAALSFEVAEHLPASLADKYVGLICSFAPIVVMSAAVPGQGGLDHVNEQPNSYWIEKMAVQNFSYDSIESSALRKEWHQNGVSPWYANNVMIFRKHNQ